MFDVLMQGVLDIPPEMSAEDALEQVPPSKLAYDIAAAASRQSVFYYQVSLPHYRDPVFISAAIERCVLATRSCTVQARSHRALALFDVPPTSRSVVFVRTSIDTPQIMNLHCLPFEPRIVRTAN
jgi:hypothetical protein